MSRSVTIRFLISGDVAAPRFPGWIRAHAAKLGLTVLGIEVSARGIAVEGMGPPEMLDALAIACSLGPAGVLVDSVT